MRTRVEIRNELADLDGAIGAFTRDESPFGVSLMREALDRRRLHLVSELQAAESADLLMVLDGPPVEDNAVEVEYLVKLLGPFERAAAAVAQALEDAATRAGVIPAAIRSQSTMRLKATFAGSFGMAMVGPTEEDQLTLDVEGADKPRPLFERSIERLMAIIEAGLDPENFDQAIIDQIGDLGQRTNSHLIDLAKATTSVGAPVEFLWAQPDSVQRRVMLTPQVAARIQEVLTHIESHDTETPIVGRLVEASLVRRTFGIETADGEVVRGLVHLDVAHRIEEFFGQQVAGTVLVTTTSSTASGAHTERYQLIRFAASLD